MKQKNKIDKFQSVKLYFYSSEKRESGKNDSIFVKIHTILTCVEFSINNFFFSDCPFTYFHEVSLIKIIFQEKNSTWDINKQKSSLSSLKKWIETVGSFVIEQTVQCMYNS